jgi:hypothetical protein
VVVTPGVTVVALDTKTVVALDAPVLTLDTTVDGVEDAVVALECAARV